MRNGRLEDSCVGNFGPISLKLGWFVALVVPVAVTQSASVGVPFRRSIVCFCDLSGRVVGSILLGAHGGGCHQGEFAGLAGEGRGWG